jgi:hypothetical protein
LRLEPDADLNGAKLMGAAAKSVRLAALRSPGRTPFCGEVKIDLFGALP